MSVSKIYDDYMEFKANWKSYTVEEREIIIRDFRNELNNTNAVFAL